MRSLRLNIILAAVGLIAGSAFPSRAEVLTYVEIQVPFAFNVGNVSFPAGSYEIVQPHESGAVIVRSAHGSRAAAAIATPFHEGAGNNASFLHINGKYYLSSIALGDGRVVQLSAPRAK